MIKIVAAFLNEEIGRVGPRKGVCKYACSNECKDDIFLYLLFNFNSFIDIADSLLALESDIFESRLFDFVLVYIYLCNRAFHFRKI